MEKEDGMRDLRTARLIPFLVLAAAACGQPEQKVVSQYFGAVNSGDEQTLSSFAVVRFDKKVDSWTIKEARPESSAPAPLPELTKRVKDLESQLAANKTAYNAYFLEHPSEVDEVRELLKKPDAKIPAKLQRYAGEWQAFTQKERDLKKAVAEAKAAVDREKKTAALSVGEVSDLESYSGELITKEVLLDLNIKGETQPYVMTLVKYKLEPSGSGQRMQSRWVVRSLKPAA
jgi:hypothetical protein